MLKLNTRSHPPRPLPNLLNQPRQPKPARAANGAKSGRTTKPPIPKFRITLAQTLTTSTTHTLKMCVLTMTRIMKKPLIRPGKLLSPLPFCHHFQINSRISYSNSSDTAEREGLVASSDSASAKSNYALHEQTMVCGRVITYFSHVHLDQEST